MTDARRAAIDAVPFNPNALARRQEIRLADGGVRIIETDHLGKQREELLSAADIAAAKQQRRDQPPFPTHKSPESLLSEDLAGWTHEESRAFMRAHPDQWQRLLAIESADRERDRRNR